MMRRVPRRIWEPLLLVLAATLAWLLTPEPRMVAIHFRVERGADATAFADAAQRLFPDAQPIAEGTIMPFTGNPAPDLAAWWRMEVPEQRVEAELARLRERGDVVTAFVEPIAELAVVPSHVGSSGACPIRTPSYQPYQGYLGPAPHGIDAPAAWSVPGGRGAGTWVADVEGAWNARHEDLPGDRITHVGGEVIDERRRQAHGTAVLGEVAARDNGIGMVGIVPDVERIFTVSTSGLGVARALYAAQQHLRAGDVLIVEIHARGPRGRYLPVEFWDDVYDVISHATGRGVIVVAAAGNGGEDLDHPTYRGRLDGTTRDSGAILVGAGAPPTPGFVDLSRLDFSNYGTRVDVQGWGRKVATLDYGDLQGCDAHDRKYTAAFAGTSSATPIVVGAVLALQGIRRAADRPPLTPLEVRALLRATGTPQVASADAPLSQRIGPRPDLARAIEALEP